MRWIIIFAAAIAMCGCGLGVDAQALETQAVDRPDRTRELHVVSLYEGAKLEGRVLRGDGATVLVDRPARDVVLYLEAYDVDHGLTWTVIASEKTHISMVILGGNGAPEVTGLDRETQIVQVSGKDPRRSLHGYYRIRSQQTRKLFRQLVDRTKQSVSSFHGIYRPDGPIRIDSVKNDPMLDVDFPQVEEVDVPDLEFHAMWYPSGTDGVDPPPSLATYSLKGGPKLESLRNVPQDCWFYTWDSDSEQWFGLKENLFLLHPRPGIAERLPGQDEVRFERSRGLMLDSKRNRLLVSSDGELYACPLDGFKWSFVAKMSRGDATHLCYHAADDSLYGTYMGYDGNSHTIPRLVRMNVHGAVISDRRIDGPYFDGMIGGHGSRTQLVSVGDYLVLVCRSSGYNGGGPQFDVKSYVLLVDPKDATARLTWKSQ